MVKRKDRTIWSRMILFAVMFLLMFLSYRQLVWNYNTIDVSYRVIQALVANQNTLIRTYEKEMALIKVELQQTEVSVDALENENEQLRKKVKMLDRLAELERMISDLKTKNSAILTDMAFLREQAALTQVQKSKIIPPLEEEHFDTVKGGRTLMAKYRHKVHKIKKIIKRIKQDLRRERISAKTEEDKRKVALGNNGYLMKNGVSSPPSMPETSPEASVSIKVEFVK